MKKSLKYHGFFFLISSSRAVSIRFATVLFSLSAILISGLITFSSSSLTEYIFLAIGYSSTPESTNLVTVGRFQTSQMLKASSNNSFTLSASSGVKRGWPVCPLIMSWALSSRWNISSLEIRSAIKRSTSPALESLVGRLVFIVKCICITNVIRFITPSKFIFR